MFFSFKALQFLLEKFIILSCFSYKKKENNRTICRRMLYISWETISVVDFCISTFLNCCIFKQTFFSIVSCVCRFVFFFALFCFAISAFLFCVHYQYSSPTPSLLSSTSLSIPTNDFVCIFCTENVCTSVSFIHNRVDCVFSLFLLFYFDEIRYKTNCCCC